MRHMHFLTIVFGVLMAASQDSFGQSSCIQLGSDECCNRTYINLPCTICNFPEAPHECCCQDQAGTLTRITTAPHSTGWSRGFWYTTLTNGCAFREPTCGLNDPPCEYPGPTLLTSCSYANHAVGEYDCP
jgi:hypothetical protein